MSPNRPTFPWPDPLALASGTASRLVLAAVLLVLLWAGVLWALVE
jgi:hypothetical protein